MSIAYVDGQRLRRLFLAGSRHVSVHSVELNRINVFPIPDGDTGTNLTLTLGAMSAAIAGLDDRSISGVANRLAEAGVLDARGNSGMMLAHFFLGFAGGLCSRAWADAQDLAAALRHAVDSLYQAVEQPVEGTLITVARETSEEANAVSRETEDLGIFAKRLLRASRSSLERTPDLLPVLRQARVVDAGAKGFVRFLEGVVALIEGRDEMRGEIGAEAVFERDAAAAAEFPVEADRAFRYCIEYLVRGTPPPERKRLAGAIRDLGGSLIVTRASSVAKIHIHSDRPGEVEQALSELGGPVERVKVEDMRAQYEERRLRTRRKVALVTDTACDLPPEAIIEHDITVVPLTVMFGKTAFLDQIDITHEQFLRRLVDPAQPQATTSQPSPAQVDESFGRAAEYSDQVLGIFVSRALSGTFGQAAAAAERFTDATVTVYDSRSASLGLGFQVLRAAELAQAGHGTDEIIQELDRLQARSGLFCTVDTLDYLRRSGRVSKAEAFLAGLLDLKPIFTVDPDGAMEPVDRVRGREALIPRTLELLKRRVPKRARRLRMGVVHVMCWDIAERLAAQLERRFAPDEIMMRPATSVLAAHMGPGAWAVFYQAD